MNWKRRAEAAYTAGTKGLPMKTHLIAFAVLLAACATPSADRVAPAPDEDEPPDELLAQDRRAEERAEEGPTEPRTTCTKESPCQLDVVKRARRRAELEADTESKLAEAQENKAMKKVAEGWLQTLARKIERERDQFSDWCEMAKGWSASMRKSGGPGLTSEGLLKWTGPPDKDVRPESREDGGVETRIWTWEVVGALSKTVTFGIMMMRPSGTDGPMLFSGCQWCAEGGPATTAGCVMLPVKK